MEEFQIVPPGEFKPTGDLQEVTTHRQEQANWSFEDRILTATEHHAHLWVVIVTHVASDQALDAMSGISGDQPILDGETIAMSPAIVCYVCEEPFRPKIRNYKCKGNPR